MTKKNNRKMIIKIDFAFNGCDNMEKVVVSLIRSIHFVQAFNCRNLFLFWNFIIQRNNYNEIFWILMNFNKSKTKFIIFRFIFGNMNIVIFVNFPRITLFSTLIRYLMMNYVYFVKTALNGPFSTFLLSVLFLLLWSLNNNPVVLETIEFYTMKL